jgi:predicted RNase H-like HicB family nuclease
VSLSQGKDQKEALENIKEANIAWLWAEDKKAIANLPPGRTHELTVAI